MKIHLGIIGIAMLEPIGGCTKEMERPKNQPKHAFYIYKYIIDVETGRLMLLKELTVSHQVECSWSS